MAEDLVYQSQKVRIERGTKKGTIHKGFATCDGMSPLVVIQRVHLWGIEQGAFPYLRHINHPQGEGENDDTEEEQPITPQGSKLSHSRFTLSSSRSNLASPLMWREMDLL